MKLHPPLRPQRGADADSDSNDLGWSPSRWNSLSLRAGLGRAGNGGRVREGSRAAAPTRHYRPGAMPGLRVRLLLLLAGLGLALGEACQNGKPSCAVCQDGASAASVSCPDTAPSSVTPPGVLGQQQGS